MLFRKKSKEASTPAPAVEPVAIAGEPDIRALGRILWAKRSKILGITLLAALAALAVVNMMTPRYRSESRLLLEARENVFLRAEADKNGGDRTTIDPEAVTSQMQLVLSRDLARQVIKKEKLAEQPEFDPAAGGGSLLKSLLGMIGISRDPATMTPEERTLESYYDRLNVYAVEKSRVIAIDFDSTNPEIAARVANTIAETYLKMQQASRQDQTRAAGSWLAGEIADLRGKVA
ncbi:MAG: Wzz/FepE/Etk N-terminal domain-containing protein, partial [Pseudolabrys sp.]